MAKLGLLLFRAVMKKIASGAIHVRRVRMDGAFSLTSIEPGDDETTDDGSVILCAQDLSPFSHTPRGEYKQ